jgi:ADP-ribosylglycohydrolase
MKLPTGHSDSSSPIVGAVIGDIIGSVFEWDRIKTKEFPLFNTESDFTDDTVMTMAVADAILNKKPYALTMQEWGRRYPGRGYGGMFRRWIELGIPEAYKSFGNGSAMRVSAVGCLFDSNDDVLAEAKRSAEVSHNHREGIKGAQATAIAILMSRQGEPKDAIRNYIATRFHYNLNRTLDDIRPSYEFNETCQGTVPEALIAFLESTGYEDAIRNAVSLGGDSDTLACITGGIAAAFYKEIPGSILKEAEERLPAEMRQILATINSR